MAISKGKTDGGQGGKLGHSNQDHWEFTEEIKLAAKKRRRLQAKNEIAQELREYLNKSGTAPQSKSVITSADI